MRERLDRCQTLTNCPNTHESAIGPRREQDRGTRSGFSGQFTRDLTLFGVIDNLPAGRHELRLYTQKIETGTMSATVNSTPWSFSVIRVGSVG